MCRHTRSLYWTGFLLHEYQEDPHPRMHSQIRSTGEQDIEEEPCWRRWGGGGGLLKETKRRSSAEGNEEEEPCWKKKEEQDCCVGQLQPLYMLMEDGGGGVSGLYSALITWRSGSRHVPVHSVKTSTWTMSINIVITNKTIMRRKEKQDERDKITMVYSSRCVNISWTWTEDQLRIPMMRFHIVLRCEETSRIQFT